MAGDNAGAVSASRRAYSRISSPRASGALGGIIITARRVIGEQALCYVVEIDAYEARASPVGDEPASVDVPPYGLDADAEVGGLPRRGSPAGAYCRFLGARWEPPSSE